MNELVSIVVPIYNMGDSVEKCVQSLRCQDYENIEIIVVNDGSTDKTAEIAKSVEDKRIKVVSVENGDDESDKKADPIDGDHDEDWVHVEPGKPTVNPPRPSQPVDYVEGTQKTINAPKEIKPSKFMYICSNPDEGKYMVDFIPSEDSDNGKLSFFLSGETEAYKAELIAASQIGGSDLKIQENSLVGLHFEKGQHIRINLQIAHKDYCSMEVKAYVNKK
jgi:hypothetical protein